MNYQKIYDQLIAKRQQNPISKNNCYCERHHIIPKSLNGSDDDRNKVNLTAREHYIAHSLLVKIMEYRYGKTSKQYEKMVCALWRFIYDNETNTIVNSHKYEKIKKIFSKMQSDRVSGTKNGMYGRKGNLSPVYGISPFKKFSPEKMQEYKLKQRKSHLGKKAWNKGLKVGNTMSEEKRQEMKIRNSGSGNPMYGHSITEYMTDEQIKKWKTNLSKNSKGRKRMYHPETLKNINPKLEDVQKYLSLGYIFGQYNRTKPKKFTDEHRKHISENHWKATGYKHMYHPITLERKLVNPNDFAKFIELGFVFGQLNKKK